jgi:hypothetical protein
MFLMSTSKLVKVCIINLSCSFSGAFGMTTRLPLRRFSLRKTVFPESLYILICLFHHEDFHMDANILLRSVAFRFAIVSVDTKSVLSLTPSHPPCFEGAHMHLKYTQMKSVGRLSPLL